MPFFAIPILIIVAIFGISFADDFIKSVDLPFWPRAEVVEEKKETAQRTPAPQPSTIVPRPNTIRQAAPSPSPPAPTSTPQPEPAPPTTSPYIGKVRISALKTATVFSPSLITLSANLSSRESVNLTAWTVKGRAGSFTIPLASKTVDPGLSLNPVYQVELQRGGKVLISSARGPFGLGSHFQPNKCMGYLRPYLNFRISVPTSCRVAKPTEAQVLFFSSACREYILEDIKYSSCTPPALSGANEVTLDRQCTAYLDELFQEFTYQGCVERNENDTDFLKNEWHLYMNTDLLTQRADAIKLYDENGLLVSEREYK